MEKMTESGDKEKEGKEREREGWRERDGREGGTKGCNVYEERMLVLGWRSGQRCVSVLWYLCILPHHLVICFIWGNNTEDTHS